MLFQYCKWQIMIFWLRVVAIKMEERKPKDLVWWVNEDVLEVAIIRLVAQANGEVERNLGPRWLLGCAVDWMVVPLKNIATDGDTGFPGDIVSSV